MSEANGEMSLHSQKGWCSLKKKINKNIIMISSAHVSTWVTWSRWWCAGEQSIFPRFHISICKQKRKLPTPPHTPQKNCSFLSWCQRVSPATACTVLRLSQDIPRESFKLRRVRNVHIQNQPWAVYLFRTTSLLWMRLGNTDADQRGEKPPFQLHVKASSYQVQTPPQAHSKLCSGKCWINSALKDTMRSQNWLLL